MAGKGGQRQGKTKDGIGVGVDVRCLGELGSLGKLGT